INPRRRLIRTSGVVEEELRNAAHQDEKWNVLQRDGRPFLMLKVRLEAKPEQARRIHQRQSEHRLCAVGGRASKPHHRPGHRKRSSFHMAKASANVVSAGTEPSRSFPVRLSSFQCCTSQSTAPLITAQPPR